MSLPALNLPPAALATRTASGRGEVFDVIRRAWVRLTPEEWVRQHVLTLLVGHRGVPAALVAVEKGFVYNRMARRADVVVYGRDGRARLLVECKAPRVTLTTAAFEQVARYNTVVGAGVILVTNGLAHAVYRPAAEGFAFLPDVPAFGDL